jgi:hypothetical protein
MHEVAGIGLKALEAQRGALAYRLGEIERGLSHGDARAVGADVEIDEDGKLHPRGAGGVLEVADVPLLVDDDGNAGALVRERQDPVDLLPGDDGRGDEDVLDARLDHHLRLANLRGADPDGAFRDLLLRENRTLVGLGMGTELRLLSLIESAILFRSNSSRLVDHQLGVGRSQRLTGLFKGWRRRSGSCACLAR